MRVSSRTRIAGAALRRLAVDDVLAVDLLRQLHQIRRVQRRIRTVAGRFERAVDAVLRHGVEFLGRVLALNAPAELIAGFDAELAIGALERRDEDVRRILPRRASALRGAAAARTRELPRARAPITRRPQPNGVALPSRSLPPKR